MTFSELTIVTSCINYGKYLKDWASSIARQSVAPGRVCIFTHGTANDRFHGHSAMQLLRAHRIDAVHAHDPAWLDLGVARNRAVALSETPWAMHLDADDMLCPGAIEDVQSVAAGADVVQSGYERIGLPNSCRNAPYLYTGADGVAVLSLSAMASGNSLFRRSLWAQSPYRTDLFGAWDTALWIGFAKLGARFRPSRAPVFQYRYHPDSVFSRRSISKGWDSVHTRIMLKGLRRGDDDAAIARALEDAKTTVHSAVRV